MRSRAFMQIASLLVFVAVYFVEKSLQNHARDGSEFTRDKIIELREEVREMFYHAYRNYLEHAFPDDELKPLACTGRKREGRGNLDDILGGFALTLIDSTDTLIVMGEIDDFRVAVNRIINTVSFNNNVTVSVFETNIRILGGLLSAHLFAIEYVPDYKGQLLMMAVDIAERLLPAFNTPTGLPYSRVNLRSGVPPSESPETCTACAGTLLLEFGMLSHLTGNSTFEKVAKRALMAIWSRRSPLGLVGNVINVTSGLWTWRDAGIGAGVDSFYEYLFKSYLLFGEPEYYLIFREMYEKAMKYMHKENWYFQVDMSTGQVKTSWIDSLSAFWPGLQVLIGDIDRARESYTRFYQVWSKYQTGLPERYDVARGVPILKHYPLRPEFVESTYFLYQYTKDPFYLKVGKEILFGLKRHCKVSCGYAAIANVETNRLEDRMDSFFLSELCKYLYLLFDPENFVNRGNYLFTTEGHIFPLNIMWHKKTKEIALGNETCKALKTEDTLETILKLPDLQRAITAKTKPLNLCGTKTTTFSSWPTVNENLNSFFFDWNDWNEENGEKYLLSGLNTNLITSIFANLVPGDYEARVRFVSPPSLNVHLLIAVQANFGEHLPSNGLQNVPVTLADPPHGCTELKNRDELKGTVVVFDRGNCYFVDKVRRAQRAGAVAVLIINNVPGDGIFIMSGAPDGSDSDITVPSVMISYDDGKYIKNYEHVNCQEYMKLNSTLWQLEKELNLSIAMQHHNNKMEDSKLRTFMQLKRQFSELDKQIMKVDIFPVKPQFKNKKVLQFIVQTPEVQQMAQSIVDQSRIYIDRNRNTIIFNVDHEVDVDSSSSVPKEVVNIVFDAGHKTPPSITKIVSSKETKLKQKPQCQNKSKSVPFQATTTTPLQKQKPAKITP